MQRRKMGCMSSGGESLRDSTKVVGIPALLHWHGTYAVVSAQGVERDFACIVVRRLPGVIDFV